MNLIKTTIYIILYTMKKFFYSFFCILILLLGVGLDNANAQEELSVPHSEDVAWNRIPQKLYATWTTTNNQVDKFSCPSTSGLVKRLTLTGWRGERCRGTYGGSPFME